ncbi:hypothetical protein SAM9427_37185 (plasmid) [Streptomyces sp. ETH9427]|uniref:hypothetical protein n=1 Tax=Streptomyces sp. E1N211 TaxID=1851876 RepID=UPI000E0A73A6|nr:hypothetical protein [Streptomyces sp. E1N211]AXI91404.1 hypothetical protein SAM9427_37185 [Streptomyces sp. ETH9427]
MNGLHGLRVLQEDIGSDAVTFENLEEGVTYLFVNPDQSWDFAIKSVMKACPDLTLQEVQDILRKHCPAIREMNERLGVDVPPLPRFEAAAAAGTVPPPPAVDKGAHRRPRPPRWARIAAVAAPALVGGTLLAHLFTPQQRSDGPAAEGVTVSQADEASLFDDPVFRDYVQGSELRCDAVSQYAAKCVDADGQVLFGEASVGDSAVFTFSYDREKLGFRVFPTSSDAALWASEEGNQRLYENLAVSGRVALWGTDEQRLYEWRASLKPAKASSDAHSMGAASPIAAARASAVLPERLAVLALGALGVDGTTTPHENRVGVFQEARTRHGVALVMGIAPAGGGDRTPAGPGDAVAVAADVLQPPSDNVVSLPPAQTRPTASNPPVATTPVSTTPSNPEPSTPKPAPATKPPVTTTPKPGQAAPVKTTPQTGPTESPAETQPTQPPQQDTPPRSEPTTPAGDAPAGEVPAQPEAEKPQPEPVTDPVDADPEPAPAEELPPTEEADTATDEVPAPETAPAPPVEEEPEEGLSLDSLPLAWAA